VKHMSDVGLASLKRSEAVRTEMYRDSAGLPTIGVGHLLTRSELASGKLHIYDEVVDWTKGLTLPQVDELLRTDLDWAELAVSNGVRVTLTAGQFDALVSFTFNVGAEAFRHSTLLRQLNAGDYAGVPAQLRRWIHAGGQESAGLVHRREEEIRLWGLG
jgi:lysozyme